ncbi:membrane-targeted effector domain-containing toxin [Pseudomonas sp. NFR16]|uniref:membrane-targeted effector domain-containing toxin n=1 Tax=Pseudomonas sp. NFR16 TaxID=1566248 RepID=UPI0008C6D468|nr:membrane-targeted effector domain-containing toxin [Pseudomonas sp. NFR16]SEJ33605.1 C-terminal region of Pasteurella multocida toxin residues 569-1285 [Pseudomonas sp. NFR16]
MNTLNGPPRDLNTRDRSILIGMSQRLVAACPDMREMAREIAREILARHGNPHLEPDCVFWHRFNSASSSARTFTGWQHVDPPCESMTLPQLVMRRFNPHDQDNADTLQMLSGFYSEGPQAQAFDERNEIRMLPSDALNDFWQVDFKRRFLAKLQTYQTQEGDDFRTLSKSTFLGKALQDHAAGWLTADQLELIFHTAGLATAGPVTVSALQSTFVPAGKTRVCTFDVLGYEASDILRIVCEDGRQILYTPGEVQAFHVLDTPKDLHWWLLMQNNRTERRARFMSHFPLSAHGQANEAAGLLNGLDLLYSTWGSDHPSVINQNSRELDIDPFTWLRDSHQARMRADAALSLRSNAELRSQMWLGYLKEVGRIAGPLAALDWPIALAAVGAGIADMGLNIDQAVNGHTTAERQAGVIGAATAAIEALFDSLFLLDANAADFEAPGRDVSTIHPAPEAEQTTPLAPVADLTELAPGPVYPVESDGLLAPFETNMLLDGYEPIREEGRMKGICLTEQGETFIEINGIAYAVRYVEETGGWIIVDPQNPFSFYRNVPVRLDPSGAWKPATRSGLQGGGKIFGKMRWGRPATTAPATSRVPGPYEIPEALKAEVEDGALHGGRLVDEAYASFDPDAPDPYAEFKRLRHILRADAQEFYTRYELPARPDCAAVDVSAPVGKTLKKLLERAPGVVFGESHSSLGSKKFLIEQMPLLAKLKVRTLYMEHLLTDFHQADLDTFADTGKMPDKLKEYVDELDKGHHTDKSGQYTFMAVLKAANENHVRIQALDCMASYRLQGLGNGTMLRQQVMNYFAKCVIDADQTANGGKKWVALVGNSHANTYLDVPGLSELEGTFGVRVEDTGAGETLAFEQDPGAQMTNELGRPAGLVKSDFRLRVPTARATPNASAIEGRLTRAGMFAVERSEDRLVIVHRSQDASVVRTPIVLDGSHFYIDRPRWPRVSGRRFESLHDLTTALQLMGMTLIE